MDKPHIIGGMTLVRIASKPSRPLLPLPENKLPDTKNFKVYNPENLRKINALRRAKSQPMLSAPPALAKWQVLFSPAAARSGNPASCYNCCHMRVGSEKCELFPPAVTVRKFTYPKEGTADSKPIEYWPVCGRYLAGEPRGMGYGDMDPVDSGLRWINAPERDLEYGGANCGGCNGGDDCDYFNPGNSLPKRENPSGMCRVMQATVQNGDFCIAWRDDDTIYWDEASNIIREMDGEENKNG